MGNETFCPDCGRLEKYCVCDIVVEYLGDSTPDFVWEHSHESVTNPETSIFRTILPQYE